MKKTVLIALAFSLWLIAPLPSSAADGHWRFLFRPFTWTGDRLTGPFRGGRVFKCAETTTAGETRVVAKKARKLHGPDACKRASFLITPTKGRTRRPANVPIGGTFKVKILDRDFENNTARVKVR